jgi:hypothetical protein
VGGVLLLFSVLCNIAQAQQLNWVKQAGGADGGAGGSGIAVDSAGNSYVTGEFWGTVTFGAGAANETTLTSVGDTDLFVAKYSSSGELTWVKQAGGVYAANSNAIAVDSAGNSYVTGNFIHGDITFGAGEANETTLFEGVWTTIFVAKYNGTTGELLWAKQAENRSDLWYQTGDRARGIAVDSAGNNYVTGEFSGTATFGAGEANETTLTSAGAMFSIFVAKYNGTTGEVFWAKQAGGINLHSDSMYGWAIAVDSSGNSYVTGWFDNTVTLGAGEANETTLASAGAISSLFVAKYNGTTGEVLWAKQAGAIL